jgi:peptidoglycan/LPS O-acetylase OafA/YrhL
MTKPLSLYLDALRFGAAFTVFLSHCGRVTAGMFWQIQPYGVTAVFVFFVLSGFVIAWVTETREGTLEEYALSRVARLYSVVLPVLIATAVLDHIAMAIDPSLYGPEPLPIMSRDPLYAVLGYALSAVFLSECWSWIVPGSNGPWWSVNYEAWYYVLSAWPRLCGGGNGWWHSP